MALTDNIISYWKLDESSGNAADSVGANTLTNNNSSTYVSALINNGVSLNGSTQTLSVASDLGITSGNWSVSTWIKPSSLPSSDTSAGAFGGNCFCFVNKDNATNNVIIYLYLLRIGGIQTIAVNRQKQNTANAAVEYTFTTPTNSFTHVAGTYNGTTLTLYVNGASVGTPLATSGTGASGGADQTGIGAYISGASAYFPGIVDETGIWSRALTSNEITSLYNTGVGLSYPFPTSSTNLSTLNVG